MMGRCVDSKLKVRRWSGDEIEDRTIQLKLNSTGACLVEVIAVFFGPLEIVNVAAEIRSFDGERVLKRRTSALEGRKGEVASATFHVVTL